MTTSIFSFGFHTVRVWAFSKQALDFARQQIINDWEFSHSPAEAIGPTEIFNFADVGEDWLHVSFYI